MRWIPAFLVFGALAPAAVLADTAQFKPVADTSIFEAEAPNNFGRQNSLPLGTVANQTASGRMLLRFDLSSLPTNAVITNVSLRITVLKQAQAPKAESVEAHRLIQPWGEGIKTGQLGALASAGEADWTDRLKGQAAWAAPGGQAGTDFATAASSSANLSVPANYTFNSTATLVADVQAWLQNPADNFGWMLLNANESVRSSAKRVASREATAAQQPLLTIGYSVPTPEPPAPQFSRFALQSGRLELGFHAEAGFIYTISFREAVDAGVWQPLTNVVAKLQPVDAVVTDAADQAGRFYQVSITGQVD
jgi:hypothetical protein